MTKQYNSGTLPRSFEVKTFDPSRSRLIDGVLLCVARTHAHCIPIACPSSYCTFAKIVVTLQTHGFVVIFERAKTRLVSYISHNIRINSKAN